MVEICGEKLTLQDIEAVALQRVNVSLGGGAVGRMDASRRVIEDIIFSGKIVYGVNTGFGKLSEVHISPDRLAELQLNLVRSHACGVGRHLSEPESRAMLLLRANVLALGYSGARSIVAETLVQLLQRGVHPVIPELGSVGASGDLAPLAHLALVLMGEGDALFNGIHMQGGEALTAASVDPLTLQAKEGLALLNGTQAMAAVGALALTRARRVCHASEVAAAMTLEALLGTPAAYDLRIHHARPQPNQREVAERLLHLLRGSEIRESHRNNDPRVQDAYCLRCVPQVHGAAITAIEFAADRVETESHCATDNPLVFAESGDVISGGNFHGAPLAAAFDFAAIGLTDLMSISERRIDRLVNPDSSEGLPAFLSSDAGLGSGYMIAHVTAAALLNHARALAHPVSIDNVPTSGGKEDHVSMGMTSAVKLREIVEDAERVIAIELMAAAEGLEHRRPLRSGHGVESAHAAVRKLVKNLTHDRPLGSEIESVATAIRDGVFDSVG